MGGTVALGDGTQPIPNGMVVVRNGRIVAAGDVRMKLPAGTQVIDATGKWVTPGIVGGFTRLGLAEVDLSAEGSDDTTANGPFSAALDVVPSVNPLSQPIAVNRADGVTRALVAPECRQEHLRRPRRGDRHRRRHGPDHAGAGVPVRRAWRDRQGQGRRLARDPRTCCSAMRCARRPSSGVMPPPIQASRGAPPERERPVISNPNESRIYGPQARRSEDVLLTRFDAAALVPVLQGRQYLLVHAERASDILQVLELKREFPSLKIVLVGVSEGWTVADRIARAGVPVIASAVNDLPASFEQIAATQSNVGRMRAAGVKVSIGMIDDTDTRNIFEERQYAGNLVRFAAVPGGDRSQLGRGAGDDHFEAGGTRRSRR